MTRADAGFTLFEGMVAAGVATVLSGALLVLGTAGEQAFVWMDTTMSSQTNARTALRQLEQDLRHGSGARLVCTPPPRADGGCLAPAAAGSWAVCTTPLILLNTALLTGGCPGCLRTAPGAEVAYAYDAAQGTLTRSVGGQTRVIMTGLVGAQRTCDLSTGVVDLALTARADRNRSAATQTLHSRIWPHNP